MISREDNREEFQFPGSMGQWNLTLLQFDKNQANLL